MADDTTAAATPAPPKAPAPAALGLEARVEAAIRAWRDTLIANGPIARATECWNHLEQALQHLATAIMKEL